MKARLSLLGSGQLAIAAIHFTARLGAWATSSSSPSYPDCTGDASLIGSGYCTAANNNAGCGYDGGDCCECTCVDGASTCGTGGYDCQDPTAPTDCSAASTGSSTSTPYPDCPGIVSLIGDGFCAAVNNNAGCGYDGGDCCECTCSDSVYMCGTGGYDCQDPTAPTDCPTTSTGSSTSTSYPDCSGTASLIGDGNCAAANNNADCGYDGGDCCECTCVDGDSTCGDNGYDCQDPAAPTDCPTTTSDDEAPKRRSLSVLSYNERKVDIVVGAVALVVVALLGLLGYPRTASKHNRGNAESADPSSSTSEAPGI